MQIFETCSNTYLDECSQQEGLETPRFSIGRGTTNIVKQPINYVNKHGHPCNGHSNDPQQEINQLNMRTANNLRQLTNLIKQTRRNPTNNSNTDPNRDENIHTLIDTMTSSIRSRVQHANNAHEIEEIMSKDMHIKPVHLIPTILKQTSLL